MALREAFPAPFHSRRYVTVHGSGQGKTCGSRVSDSCHTMVLLLSMVAKTACFPGLQGVHGLRRYVKAQPVLIMKRLSEVRYGEVNNGAMQPEALIGELNSFKAEGPSTPAQNSSATSGSATSPVFQPMAKNGSFAWGRATFENASRACVWKPDWMRFLSGGAWQCKSNSSSSVLALISATDVDQGALPAIDCPRSCRAIVRS